MAKVEDDPKVQALIAKAVKKAKALHVAAAKEAFDVEAFLESSGIAGPFLKRELKELKKTVLAKITEAETA